MKILSSLACAAGIALATIGSAQAAAVVNDWYFNPNGTGAATATKISENLDFTGQAMILITPTGGGNFTFKEFATFKVSTYDGFFDLPTPNFITATFVATGSGTFSGGFSFNSGGELKLYSDAANNIGLPSAISNNGADDGNLIGTFTTFAGGGGQVDATGNPTGNGQVIVNAYAGAGDLATGYWFDPAMLDLSLQDILSFAFTNANPLQTIPSTIVKELACEWAGVVPVGVDCATGAGFSSAANPTILFIGNNGQFKLAEVPEPASLALVGLALVAAGGVRRRVAAKRA
jgi:PEP-CTERM motif